MAGVLHNGHEEITFIDIDDNMWMLNKKSGALFQYQYSRKRWARVEVDRLDIQLIMDTLDELL